MSLFEAEEPANAVLPIESVEAIRFAATSRTEADDEGRVHVPQRPGLGYDIDWGYVENHRVE